MKKILWSVLLGMCLSNAAGIYARLKFERWTKTHRPTQGMPDTWDMRLAELIERPIEVAAKHPL